MPRIAFYAPLKPPDHPIPSGDRQMARMLLAALKRAGYDAFLASSYISYSKRHQAEYLQARREGAIAEANRLLAQWESHGGAPDLWFCYHPYDKSPDWLGMEICARLAIPMVTAEPCKTGQGPNGEWLPWRAEAQRGIAMADLNIVMTDSDYDYVSGFAPADRIARFPPFLDIGELAAAAEIPLAWNGGSACRLLSVGMMRPGAKLESYQMLAAALRQIADENWALTIAGGGPAEAHIREEFAFAAPGKVEFAGELAQEQVFGAMRQADVLAWPGCREAYGMVYLEAAAQGLPSAALRNMGVPMVVEDGRTGLLADPPDAEAYAAILSRLIAQPDLRRRLGHGARDFVTGERSGEQAAARLRELLDPVLKGRSQ
jgi:glycosyltransferase involved in cell wall biosynthesis